MIQFGLYNLGWVWGLEWWVIITDKTSKIHTKAPQQPTECYIKFINRELMNNHDRENGWDFGHDLDTDPHCYLLKMECY